MLTQKHGSKEGLFNPKIQLSSFSSTADFRILNSKIFTFDLSDNHVITYALAKKNKGGEKLAQRK